MTIARRQAEIERLITEHPGWSALQIAHTLGLPLAQVETGIATLVAKGRVETDGLGFRRRASGIRSFRRTGAA